MLWHAPFSPEQTAANESFLGHMVDSSLYRPRPQIEANLRDLLATIANLRAAGGGACFDEIQFRFAVQGAADPGQWEAWDESQFQQNWNFLYHARRIIGEALAGTAIRLTVDLGAELGGYDLKQTVPYIQRLWGNYRWVFSGADSYGFSIALVPGRVGHYLRSMQQVGFVPDEIAVDVYYSAADWLASALASCAPPASPTRP